jgi:hypothetical protein
MSSSLSPLAVQRLAYIRYLYRQGVEASRRPGLLSATAITSFHDAVENLLGLTAEHLRVELPKQVDFLQYWPHIKPVHALPGQANMKRLNDMRVALKHNGTFPSARGVEQAREYVLDFLAAVTAEVFGVEFDRVDMTDLVTQGEVALTLRQAQQHADLGDFTHAMAGLSVAFRDLLRHYASPAERFWDSSPFTFGPTLFRSDRPRRRADEMARGVVKLMEITEEMQFALRMISLGIDYPQYARFAVLAPRVHGYMDGHQSYYTTSWDNNLDRETFDWALQFVIESSLRAANADGIHEIQEAQMQAGWGTSSRRARNWEGAPAEFSSTEDVSSGLTLPSPVVETPSPEVSPE